MSLAKVIISGTVISDPEKRFTPNQNVAVTTFGMSVQPPSRGMAGAPNEPFTIKVTAWRQLAEAVGDSIRKGDEVIVEGKLMINSYTTPEGVAKKGYEIDLASISKVPGPLEPVLAAVGAESGARGGGGGYDRGNGGGGYATAPANRAAAQPAAYQSAAPQGGMFQNSGSIAEDILTEDDIPF